MLDGGGVMRDVSGVVDRRTTVVPAGPLRLMCGTAGMPGAAELKASSREGST